MYIREMNCVWMKFNTLWIRHTAMEFTILLQRICKLHELRRVYSYYVPVSLRRTKSVISNDFGSFDHFTEHLLGDPRWCLESFPNVYHPMPNLRHG
jgi:hypothetical protein